MNIIPKEFFNANVRNADLQQVKNFQNFLQPTQYKISMDRLKFPTVEYTVQNVSLPDISVSSAILPSPQREIPIPGDSIEFGDLDFQFQVDEAMLNYEEIFLWLVGNLQIADNDRSYKKTRDMTLHITSSHNNVTRNIDFYDAFPVNLSGLPFDITTTDTEYLIANATFQYSYYIMGKLQQLPT